MKKNIRVEIPRNARELLKLAIQALEKHDELGADSPFINIVDMDDFRAKLAIAVEEVERSERLRKDAEAATERRNNVMGIAKNQVITTKGTILNMVASLRDALLGKFKGEEHQMGVFGFNVSSSHRKNDSEEEEGGDQDVGPTSFAA